MKQITPRLREQDRRALRLGAYVVVPALVWSLMVRPYTSALSITRDAVAAERALLERERALLASAPAMPGALAKVALSDSGLSATLFVAPDAYAASAALTAHVSEAAAASGIALRQSETSTPAIRADGLVELGLDVQGEGDFEGVLELLRLLEGGDRLIHAARLSMERSPAGLGGAEVLAVSASLRSFARVEARSSNGGATP